MWFRDNPVRWQQEQDSIKAVGAEFDIDLEALEHGVARISVTVDKGSTIHVPEKFLPLKLNVVYPPGYPFFRPEVYANNITLARHHNPIGKNLCLLPRNSSFWLPETTIGNLLLEQLPKVMMAGEVVDSEALRGNNEEQAEPISDYYPHVPNAPVMIDTVAFDLMPADENSIKYLGSFTVGFQPGAAAPARIWALECFDAQGQSISKLPDSLTNMFPPKSKGHVYRLQTPPPYGDPKKDRAWLSELARTEKSSQQKAQNTKLKNETIVNEVCAITFPEEHQPGVQSWGWLFLITCTFHRPVQRGNKIIQVPIIEIYYARANRINLNELSQRIPSLHPLKTKTVAVVGLGALGAPSVIEFAKNGIGEIRLVDFDYVSSGSIVRWPLGLSVAGMYKVDALTAFIAQNYPYVRVSSAIKKVGQSDIGLDVLTKDYNEHDEFIDTVLKDVSMIYDATAEIGISHFLAVEAKKRGIPFVSIFATSGVWGGAVLRVIPDLTKGCWMCFQHALKNGDIPSPPVDRAGTIQPTGCGDVSFTGTSFELSNIISAGIRLATGTLCGAEGGYGELDGDIGILSLVDGHGRHSFPQWSVYPLAVHQNCSYCNPA